MLLSTKIFTSVSVIHTLEIIVLENFPLVYEIKTSLSLLSLGFLEKINNAEITLSD